MRIVILILSVFMLVVSTAAADPAITGVSGNIQHGESITVTGSGFGTKSPAKPYLWADFSGGNTSPSSLGVKTSWSVSNMSYAAEAGPTGGPALEGTANNGTWLAGVDSTSDGVAWNDYGQQLYIFRKIKRNFDYGSINFKVFRVWCEGTTLPDFYMAFGDIWNSYVEGVNVSGNRNGSWFDDSPYVGYAAGTVDEWQRDEIIWQSNSASDQSDGIFQFYTNSNLVTWMPNVGRGYVFKPKDSSSEMVLLFPVHGVKANVTFSSGENYWATDVYVDTTWARIMVGNASTWAASTHKEPFIPASWGSDSITATVNRGEFGATDSAYLYVIDADGAVNETGYAITFGDTGDPPTISAPSGFRTGGGSTWK